jgi:hypothetical protein
MGQAPFGPPLPGPPIHLVDAWHTQETAIPGIRRWRPALTRVLTAKDEPTSFPLEHDDLTLGRLVQETEPLPPSPDAVSVFIRTMYKSGCRGINWCAYGAAASRRPVWK